MALGSRGNACWTRILNICERDWTPTSRSYLAAATCSCKLFNARYEKRAMILTSNRGFAEWGEIFGSPVVATALLDRLLHHAIVIQIDGSSYRLRRHADLLPEHVRSNALITPPASAEPRRLGRAPKNGGAAQTT
jgi:hypothetical protein